MKNILVTGSVLNSDKNSIEVYNKVIESLKGKFKNVHILSPLDTMKFCGSNEERFKSAVESVLNADLVIAEVSNPSHGQGMELMLAKQENKKVILLAKEYVKVSGLVLGAFGQENLLRYNENNLSSILSKKL